MKRNKILKATLAIATLLCICTSCEKINEVPPPFKTANTQTIVLPEATPYTPEEAAEIDAITTEYLQNTK